MEVRELFGETYRAFEVSAPADAFTADVLNKIRKMIDKRCPTELLHSITMYCDPYSEDRFIYKVVLYL